MRHSSVLTSFLHLLDKICGGVSISGSEIIGRTLELVVPAGVGRPGQMATLEALVDYADTIGIKLVITAM